MRYWHLIKTIIISNIIKAYLPRVHGYRAPSMRISESKSSEHCLVTKISVFSL